MYQGKTHIHIENSRSSPQIFIGTEEHVAELLRENADIAGKLHITIGASEVDPVDQWTEEDLKDYYEKMATADVLVGYSFPTKDVAKYAPELKMIHFISSGINHMIPLSWAPEQVKLINNRGVHGPKASESFLMFLLMLNARMPRLVTLQREGRWDALFTTIIKGKTLTVLGVGHQGSIFARRGKELGMKVIGVGPTPKDHPHCDEFLPLSGMKDAFSRSDFVAVAAPLTPETKGIIGEEALSWLPPHAGLINISRGGLVDHAALDRSLRSGKLDGAILDVTDPEPLPPGSPTWDTPNLIITPHVTSDDQILYMPLTLELTMKNVRRMLAGEELLNVVDPSKAY